VVARRDFIGRVANGNASAQKTGSLGGFDHVALPTQNVDAMLAFYRGLCLQINEAENACSVLGRDARAAENDARQNGHGI